MCNIVTGEQVSKNNFVPTVYQTQNLITYTHQSQKLYMNHTDDTQHQTLVKVTNFSYINKKKSKMGFSWTQNVTGEHDLS